VGGLAIYDPASAPGGELTVKDICRLISQRIHLLPEEFQELLSGENAASAPAPELVAV
jgi:hypothetical protein